MARTLAAIQQQIAKLQQEADSIKTKEVAGVIEKIRTAVAFYELTPADLFGESNRAANRPPAEKVPKPAKAKGKEKAKVAAAPKIRFADDQGNTWVGRGKRPQWFVAALAAGKTPAELQVKPE